LLINVYRDRPAAIPGTRLMEAQLGIEGVHFTDPLDARRAWQIENVYLPIPGRAIGGIRAKVRDQKGFISFCNQRDLEVILGEGRPGELCPWLDDGYVGVDDDDWVGMACDEEDLRDDLFEREWVLRSGQPLGILTAEYDIARRIHLGRHYDAEELFQHRQYSDVDFITGQSPDTRLETLEQRWIRVERMRVRWEKV
jgi:hypothetical protein